MADDPNTDLAESAEGELIDRASEGFGVRVKLETYSLDVNHKDGGPKARGFEQILVITLEHVDYLDGAIYTGIQLVPVSEVIDNAPWGIKCVVMIPVRGLGEKSGRIVDVRTVWQFDEPGAPPRLVSAYIDS
jgi:hypothetical protein